MTLHLDDARWRSSKTTLLVDGAEDADQTWLHDYEPHDPEIATEKAVLDALAESRPAADVDDAAAIAGALEEWGRLRVDGSGSRRRWAGRAAVASGLLVAGVAAGLLLGVGPTPHDETVDGPRVVRADRQPGSDDLAPITTEQPVPPSRPDPPLEEPPRWQVRSGSAVAEAHDEPPTSLPQGIVLVARGQLCVLPTPNGEVCLEDGSQFEIVGDDRIQLRRGRARVDASQGPALSVEVDDVRIEADGPSVYVIEYEVAGWSLTVEEGTPVVHTERTHTTVQPGQTLMERNEHSRSRRPGPDPAARLAAARAARAKGDRERAAEIYEELIASSPRAPLARVATVSLGQLYLELGRPKQARAAFDRYLARGPGALSEDAAFGRLRALRALGSPALEPAAAEFLRRHPDSAFAPRVRRWSE